MKKILKLRFLLPLLAVGYVVAGFAVWSADVVTGHAVFAVLSFLTVLLVAFGFNRYDNHYRDASKHRAVFNWTLGLGALFLGLAIYHIVGATLHIGGFEMVVGFEVGLAVAAFLGGLLWAIEMRKRDERQEREELRLAEQKRAAQQQTTTN